MGKRGPKPVDVGLLNFWECEWYKAFHVLRDGTALPGTRAVSAPPHTISSSQVRDWVRKLKAMDEAEYLKINNLACKAIAGERHADQSPSDEISLWWAREQKEREIAELERYLNPKKITAETERRALWQSLWHAETTAALQKVCERWALLEDVRARGLVVFPNYVLANAHEFLRMKRDRRFPKSDSPTFDESRLEYLARGMAGILAEVSPMTGIERLRNMQHAKGGPLWAREPGGREYCGCWRCGLDASRPAHKLSALGWWNGMALFMKLADQSRISKQGRSPNEPARNI